MSETALMTYQGAAAPMNVTDVKAQVNLIQHIMAEVMKDGEHYGKIPGCGDRPTLLKPGAEKIAMTFRFAVDPDVDIVDFPSYHREYRVRVRVTNSAGEFLGSGVGCASTLESKYRFRTGPLVFSENVVPKAYWDMKKENPAKAQEIIGGRGFIPKKGDNGIWYICTQGEKCEHDNPADYWNTILKMAKKRALVDAILTVTAASDIFTQDIEDAPELYTKTVVPDNHPAAEAELEKQKEIDRQKKAQEKAAKKAQEKAATPTGTSDQDPGKQTDQAKPETAGGVKTFPTVEDMNAFWTVFEKLAAETAENRDDIIRKMSKNKIDPLAADQVPQSWILDITKKAETLLAQVMGV